MSEIEVDLSYKEVLRLLHKNAGTFADENLEDLRLIKVRDIPSKFLGKDRVRFYIDVV